MEKNSLKAILEIENEGKEFEVLSLDYELSLPINNNYKPSTSAARGGIINFAIRSPLKKTLLFHDWLLHPIKTGVKNGKFTLPLTHRTEQELKELSFTDAYCINLHESYSASDTSQMYMRITIVAKTITFSENVKFEQSVPDWIMRAPTRTNTPTNPPRANTR